MRSATSARALDGAIVVLTRRREDNAPLAWRLREAGAEVIDLPCIRTEGPADPGVLASALRELRPDDLLVLTSRTAADVIAHAVPRGTIPCAVAAVGDATAERAAAIGLEVGFVASRADGATLGRELPLPRGTVLLARSDIADPSLPAALRARGAAVREVVAYRTIHEIVGDPGTIVRALSRGAVTVVVASPSAVDALVSALGAPALRPASFVAIGPRTAEHVLARIGRRATVARGTDVEAILVASTAATREEALP